MNSNKISTAGQNTFSPQSLPAGAGALSFTFGPMASGKSTCLIDAVLELQLNGDSAAIFTSLLDTRTTQGYVADRRGRILPAQVYSATTDFCSVAEDPPQGNWFIDEAQFLTVAQVNQLHAIAHRLRIHVSAYGLRADFRAAPFAGSAQLMAQADFLLGLVARCSHCAAPARHTARYDTKGQRQTEGPQIAIESGTARYLPVCGPCFQFAAPLPGWHRNAWTPPAVEMTPMPAFA